MSLQKINLSNWLDEVSFNTSEDKIDEFNKYLEDQGLVEQAIKEGTEYYVDMGSFQSDPYQFFEPDGQFVVVSEYYLDDGAVDAKGFLVDFVNCNCPEECKEFLIKIPETILNGKSYYVPGFWLFIDRKSDKIITDNLLNEKLINISNGIGDCIIDNSGDGVVRFQDFNFKKIFEEYLEDNIDNKREDISNQIWENKDIKNSREVEEIETEKYLKDLKKDQQNESEYDWVFILFIMTAGIILYNLFG
ncbi:hypothetical protein N9P06_00880 [Flavobacteriaceae bacterium]|nr:hypothetical protein [Flavobacteriaceae bacterium]